MNPFTPMGVIRGIAVRPRDGESMVERSWCKIEKTRGAVDENRPAGKREVTLLGWERWQTACRDLGLDLPWTMRRANLLIEGVDLAASIGNEVSIGPVRLMIHGETKPCKIMDQQHAGLKVALIPDCRGGVFGEVLVGGQVQVGDPVIVHARAGGDSTPVRET